MSSSSCPLPGEVEGTAKPAVDVPPSSVEQTRMLRVKKATWSRYSHADQQSLRTLPAGRFMQGHLPGGKADDVTGTIAFPLGARTIAEASSCSPPHPSWSLSGVFSRKSGDLPSECLKPFWDPTQGQRDTNNVVGEGRGCFSEG